MTTLSGIRYIRFIEKTEVLPPDRFCGFFIKMKRFHSYKQRFSSKPKGVWSLSGACILFQSLRLLVVFDQEEQPIPWYFAILNRFPRFVPKTGYNSGDQTQRVVRRGQKMATKAPSLLISFLLVFVVPGVFGAVLPPSSALLRLRAVAGSCAGSYVF
jgi:hypothetical protein